MFFDYFDPKKVITGTKYKLRGKKKSVGVKWPKEIQELTKYLLKEVGKPCESYEPSCGSCQAWMAWLLLVKFFEDV